MPLPIILGVAAVISTETVATAATATIVTPLVTFFLSSLGVMSVGGLAALIPVDRINAATARRAAAHHEVLRTERDTLRATAAAAEALVATSAVAIGNIIQETDEAQTHLNAETERLETQNTAMQTEIDRLNTEATALSETNQAAASTITALTTELAALREHSTTIHTNLTEATEALRLTEETLAETTRQLDTLRDSQEENEQQHQVEMTHLRSELRSAEQAPGLIEENQALEQRLRITTAQYQGAAITVRTYAEALRGARRELNTQNPEGETLDDERRNTHTAANRP